MAQPVTVSDRLWSALDLGTRWWWRLYGHRVDMAGAEAWLQAPANELHEIGSSWLDRMRAEGRVGPLHADAGLMPTLSALDGPDFNSNHVHPLIRDFYEHTSAYHMDVWNQWSSLLAPGGAMISSLFGRRVEQLALPIRPMEVCHGLTNELTPVRHSDGSLWGTAWLRSLRSTGTRVYGGFYRTGLVPDSPQPHVSVAFPLEQGYLQVFLKPEAGADGSLWLRSRSLRFGGDGAYIAVRFGSVWYAAQVKLREIFHVYVDPDGILRTDHWLSFHGFHTVHLHYRLTRLGTPGAASPESTPNPAQTR